MVTLVNKAAASGSPAFSLIWATATWTAGTESDAPPPTHLRRGTRSEPEHSPWTARAGTPAATGRGFFPRFEIGRRARRPGRRIGGNDRRRAEHQLGGGNRHIRARGPRIHGHHRSGTAALQHPTGPARDREGFGGAVLTMGITTLCCLWCATPSRSLWEAILTVGGVSLTAAIGITRGRRLHRHMAPDGGGGGSGAEPELPTSSASPSDINLESPPDNPAGHLYVT
jgi:hypothetical protein